MSKDGINTYMLPVLFVYMNFIWWGSTVQVINGSSNVRVFDPAHLSGVQ